MTFHIPEEIIINSSFSDRRVSFYCYLYSALASASALTYPKAIFSSQKVNEEYHKFLSAMVSGGYLEVTGSNELNSGYTFTEKSEVRNSCGKIYSSEVVAIALQNRHVETTLLLLAFIRLRMGIGRFTNFHINEIIEQLGISRYRITESMKVLSDLGILEIFKTKRYQDNHGKWHSGYFVFKDI